MTDQEILEKVSSEVDIISDAPQKFIEEVLKIENITDLAERAQEAKNYIDTYNGLKEINYEVLGTALSDPEKCMSTFWRQLYLLERSIKPRSTGYSWVQRLKMFYNTYLEEHAVQGNTYKKSKFYFYRKSGDHDILHYGSGNYAPDFYYFDNSIPGTTIDKMVLTEFKYCPFATLNEAANYYKGNYNYGVKHIVAYKAGEGFYMLDYTADPVAIIKLDNISEPTGLFKIIKE